MHARHVAQGGTGQLAVGLEMFYKQHQPILDDYVFGSGTRTLASLKEDTRWEETWGWKLAHYSKILNYARMHGIRVCGLNVPQPVVKVRPCFALRYLDWIGKKRHLQSTIS